MKFTTFQQNMFRMAACLHRSGIHPNIQKWATTYTALPAKDQRFLYDTLAGSDGSDRRVVEKVFSSFGVKLKFPYLGSLLREGCLHRVEYDSPRDREGMIEAIKTALSGERHNENDCGKYKGCYHVDMIRQVGAGGAMVNITRESASSGVFVRYAIGSREGLMLDVDTYISR